MNNPTQRLSVLTERNVLLMINANPEKYPAAVTRLGGPDALERRLIRAQADYEELLQSRQEPDEWLPNDADNDCERCGHAPFAATNPGCATCWYRPDDINPMQAAADIR
jgi:hypothetical protein